LTTDGFAEKELSMPWLVVDIDAMIVVRGPYKYSETAAAVRAEIETGKPTRTYWICKAKSTEDWYARHKKAVSTEQGSV
jgi:hypothetical protein